MLDNSQLQDLLSRLDGSSYKAYKQLKGVYAFAGFTLSVDFVQGDPFAAPSRVSLRVPAQFPQSWLTLDRSVALADFLNRQVYQQAQRLQQRRGSGKGGTLAILPPSQAILTRTSLQVTAAGVEARLGVGLPGYGRRIAGTEATALLCKDLPQLVSASLVQEAISATAVEQHLNTYEDAIALRQQLSHRGLVGFIADGACLPRCSGVDARPLTSGIPFASPPALRVTLQTPHAGSVSGMGIPAGVTLIVGGGYHGKSTVLKALEMGVYNHIPGDGRERVVSHGAAVKVRAEDGRSVCCVDISPFIGTLPQGVSTRQFSTVNASGSTSQAASLIEALEAGAKVLLIDEDTAATNLMIRDRAMQALISKDKEPITPFIDKVRQLYADLGVSTVLVMGGSGDYFSVADTVIALDSYRPEAVTERAKALVQLTTARQSEGTKAFGEITPRQVALPPFGRGQREPKVSVRGVATLTIDREDIDLRAVEQLVEPGQLRAIAQALIYAERAQLDRQPLADWLKALLQHIQTAGLDSITDYPQGDLVAFRAQELAAALSRLRTLTAR